MRRLWARAGSGYGACSEGGAYAASGGVSGANFGGTLDRTVLARRGWPFLTGFLGVLFLVLPAFWASAGIAPEDIGVPEPGPEHRGLRLRLVVDRQEKDGEEIFDVRVDLINTTDKTIVLTAGWLNDRHTGGFLEYFEACIGIETFPPIGRREGQVAYSPRKSPQPKMDLAPRGLITTSWTSSGRKLKNTLLCPISVQNPQFPADGLYSVHAVAMLQTDRGRGILRSNEQQVPVGGSYAMPKYSLGMVTSVDAETGMARVNLGSGHRIAVGDKFRLRVGVGPDWRMDVDRVDELQCSGKVVPADARGQDLANTENHELPSRGAEARLITE